MIKFDEQVKNTLQRQLSELRNEHSMKVSEDTIAEEEELNPKELETIVNGKDFSMTGMTLNEITKKHEAAIQKHEEIKSEVKEVLGLDLDKLRNVRFRPTVSKRKGKK
jgi:predicted transcriptional regulator